MAAAAIVYDLTVDLPSGHEQRSSLDGEPVRESPLACRCSGCCLPRWRAGNLWLTPQLSMFGRFDSQFSDRSYGYAGSGGVQVKW
jgi:hypothetical protein